MVDVLCKHVYNFIHACMSSTNEVVNFVAKHGAFHSRILSFTGRNVQYLCERYDMNSHDFLNYSPSDISRISRYYQGTIDQQTHTLAQLIFELVMVRDGEWSLSNNNFTKDDMLLLKSYVSYCVMPSIQPY